MAAPKLSAAYARDEESKRMQNWRENKTVATTITAHRRFNITVNEIYIYVQIENMRLQSIACYCFDGAGSGARSFVHTHSMYNTCTHWHAPHEFKWILTRKYYCMIAFFLFWFKVKAKQLHQFPQFQLCYRFLWFLFCFKMFIVLQLTIETNSYIEQALSWFRKNKQQQ